MRVRFPLLFTAVVLAALPVPARAADEPAIVLRAKSIDQLLGDFQYLADMAGQGDKAKEALAQIDKFRDANKGFRGVDGKRPFGGFGNIGPNILDSSIVVLVPVSDEKAFLGLLEENKVQLTKEKDGAYSVAVPNAQIPVAIYLRFIKSYACIAVGDRDALAPDKLSDPATVLTGKKSGEAVAASVRIDKIPDAVKQLALGQLELQVANLQDQKIEGETEAQKRAREASTKETVEQITAVIKDGREMALTLDLDRQNGTIGVEFSLSALPNTKLHKMFAEQGTSMSRVAGLLTGDSVARANFRSAVAEGSRPALIASLEETVRKGLAEEKDEAKRRLGEKLFQVLEPTLKAGEIDAAAEMRGPTSKNLYTLVAASQVKDGKTIAAALPEIVKDLPEASRKHVQVNAESAGDVKIHRVDVHKGEGWDADAKKTFGDNPLYFAVAPEMMVFALGDEALAAVKQALKVQPKSVQPMRIEASVARLVAAFPGKHTPQEIAKAAEAAFGGKSGQDTVRMVLEGGDAVRMRIDAKVALLKFVATLEEGKKDK